MTDAAIRAAMALSDFALRQMAYAAVERWFMSHSLPPGDQYPADLASLMDERDICEMASASRRWRD